MNRKAMVQVLEAVVLGVAMVLSGTLAASAQQASEARQGPSAGFEANDAGHVATGPTAPAEVSAVTSRAYTIAEALRHEAERLHSLPERWVDAAVLHIHSADMRGLRGEVALSELFIAGGLFYETGELEDALITLEMAGDQSLGQGASDGARFAYEQAAALAVELGDREAAERLVLKAAHIPGHVGPFADEPSSEAALEGWRELLVETVIPAPVAAVAIVSPATNAPARLEEGLDLVSLSAPPEPELAEIGSAGVILPAPTFSLDLQAPADAEDLTDSRLDAPELQQTDVRLAAVRARDLPVTSLTVVPVPAPAAVRIVAPEIETVAGSAPNDSAIDVPELEEPPLPALPEL